jgi:hypothetical protein
MKSLCFALAVDMSDLRALQRTSPAKTGLGLVLAAISGVVAVVLVWAVFFRKRPDETMRRYREYFSSSNAKEHPQPRPVLAANAGAGGAKPPSAIPRAPKSVACRPCATIGRPKTRPNPTWNKAAP